MTRFTGPVKVKKAFSDVSVARIDASGSAHFAQGADFGGVLYVTGTAQIGDGTSQGKVALVQSLDLTNATTSTTAAVVPDGSDVTDVRLFVGTAFATAAADVEVRIGTSANESLFGVISMDTNIAGGMHVLANGAFTSAGTTWLGLSGAGAQIVARVTAVSGAIASGAAGTLFITYIQ